jgi:O-antigen ligase
MLFGLFPLLYFAFATKRLVLRGILLTVAVVMMLSIVFSLSRGTSIVIVIVMPYLFYRLRDRISPWKVVVPVVLLGLCILPLIPLEYYERMALLVSQDAGYDWTLYRRIGYHIVGLDLLSDSPVWGTGPGSFPLYYTANEYRFFTTGYAGGRVLHNIYLAVACQVGLLGLLFFLLTIFFSLRSLRFVAGSYREGERNAFLKVWAEAFEVGFVALLIAAVLLPNEYSKYLWMSVGMTAAVEAIRRRQLARLERDVPSAPSGPDAATDPNTGRDRAEGTRAH